MTTAPIKICMDRNTNEVTCTVDWFLRSHHTGIANSPEKQSEPVPATIQPLINGEAAFGAVYDAIDKAKYSVDIAIWGFQPSMFFKRDGNSPCIGELLITKILNNPDFQVRILVWDMALHIQTFVEANLGSIPGLLPIFQKGGVDGVSSEQIAYDKLWYRAIAGNIIPLAGAPYFTSKVTIEHSSFEQSRFNTYLLETFSLSPLRKNLQFKFRTVSPQHNKYLDEELPYQAKAILHHTASHHQKTVLIDYEHPEEAIGFVLEHNMVDNYWDTDEHCLKTSEPNKGKNIQTPLQDVSSLVTGEVLWDINYNFCQSWGRKTNKPWVYPLTEDYTRGEYGMPYPQENLMAKRQSFTRKHFKPDSNKGTLTFAQILRTYDEPDVEDIKAMYLKNIKHTTSYIYTENQYFRFPPLVKAFLAHWNKMKEAGRDVSKPIHWFVVTNSSDAGIGSGTYTTNHMFKLLGRQDVMPNVAKKVREEELGILDKSEKARKIRAIPVGTELKKAQAEVDELEQKLLTDEPYHRQAIAELKQKITELQKVKDKVTRLSDKNSDAEQNRNLTQQLYGDLYDNPGIKVHICTLAPQSKDNPNQYINDINHEVYVHSKVTIIDDVFTFIGSANLNTRSMQVDTELGIITECKRISQGLRQRLWEIHTKQRVGSVINPVDLSNYQEAEKAFEEWGEIMKKHKGKSIIDSPLREFIRMSPKISKSD